MLNFPDAPSIGQRYPTAAGLPSYVWDGEKWRQKTLPFAPPSDAAPLMDNIAGPGSANAFARGDHRHPSDTKYAPVNNPTFTGTLTAQTFNVNGNFNGGVVTALAKGHHIGNTKRLDNTLATWDNVTTLDANIIFYDYGSGNWAGIGADQSGFFWVRTGAGGSDNVSAFVATLSNVQFNGPTYAPTPANGDNSTKLATTAFVNANQPMGGPYLPTSGGTITGTMTVSYAHIMSYRAGGTTGVVYFGTDDRYFYYDGSNYVFGTDALFSAAGRMWGSNDWTRPVTSARIGPHAGDYFLEMTAGFVEPYGGAVITGSTGLGVTVDYKGTTNRYRYNQIYVEGTWYTAGYV
jgi:hypothetical protein